MDNLNTHTPVLATCDIRQPELASENTSYYLLLLADCPEEEYYFTYASAHLHKGGMDIVQGIHPFLFSPSLDFL